MRKTKFQRVTAFVLVLTFLLCAVLVPVNAATEPGDDSLAALRERLNAISYADYIELYGNSANKDTFVEAATVGVSVPGKDGQVSQGIDLSALSAEERAALTDEQKKNYAAVGTYDGVEGLYVPGTGSVTWTLDPSLPQYASLATAKRYYLEIDYYPVANKSTSIEREFMINDKVPFSEARYLTISKVWRSVYEKAAFEVPEKESADTFLNAAKEAGIDAVSEVREGKTFIIYTIPQTWTPANAACVDENILRFFLKDIDQNEIRASLEQAPEWCTYQFKDSNGFVETPFEFVIGPNEKGVITLTLASVNEPMVISAIRLVPPTARTTYEDYRAQYAGVAAGEGQIKIEAEYYSASSSQTIYPVSDNTSAITSPASNSYTVLNSIGGDKWQSPGQWISYKFKVDKTGMYKIATRFRQNLLEGMYSSRVLSLYGGDYNGVPFAEAARLRFNYSSNWQSGYLTDGTTEFEFYFEEGVEYEMRFEVSLGDMGEIVSRVQASLNAINADYLSILKLTGASPDEDRDYGFYRVLPTVMADLAAQKAELKAISEYLAETAGDKSTSSADLEKVWMLLDTMTRDNGDNVAKNMEQLKGYIGTLGTWLSDAKTQPLLLDCIVIQSEEYEVPRAKANFWEAIVYEITGFFKSFFRNYDRVGAMSEEEREETVEVWLAYGRDQAQVIRALLNNDFTPQYHVPVNLKLVAAGTLLPSILSGKGPDVYIGIGQGDIINYAIRGALEPIEEMPDFDTVAADFNESAMMVLGIADKDNNYHCYGLPETQSFPMMFIRTDVLADLGLEVPKTWDDVKAAIPVLQANNMQIGMTKNENIFIYQLGGELFADNGMRINLDSNVALEAFETMCDMFTMYSFPYAYDFANRFRTGEMPIGFADYTATYNQLKVFATEIEGLWEFRPLPGYYVDGKLNNVSVSTVTAIAMITGCDNKDGAWKFMKWHSGADCQINYSNEMVAILGPSAKHPTANRQALASLPWTTSEYNQLQAQFDKLAAVPNYPGAYIVARYTNFAFLAAYNNNANPVTELQSYINTINKEITRKRIEFELEPLDYVGQTLAEKRMLQAETKLKEAMKKAEYNEAAYKATCDNVLLLLKGYETEDYASLRALADALDSLNKDLFGGVSADMRSAAAALESYEAYK